MDIRFQARCGTILATACGLLLGGCASMSEDKTQAILVRTQQVDGKPVDGMHCVLSNKLGQWTVQSPAEVTVKRADSPLWVSCASDSWEMAAATTQAPEGNLGKSTAKGAMVGAGAGALLGLLAPITLPFVGPMVMGSVLMGGTAGAMYGGLTGAIVDGASGAHYDYAPEMLIQVKPREAKAAKAEPTTEAPATSQRP